MLSALIAAALGVAVPSDARAQEPTKGPVRILLPFADDASFAIAHLLAEPIGNAVGRPVVVERKPGATGRIAAEALKHSASDGNTLFLAPIVVPVLGPLVFRNLNYDPAKDFAPIAQVATFRYALAVGPNHPARTGPEFVAWAKAHRSQATFGTAGAGSVPHFFGVMVGQAAGVDMIHVPYKGAQPMTADLMGGQIAAGIDALPNLVELHRAGKVRILATSGVDRSPLSPSVPTLKEQGLTAFEAVGWIAMYARAGTPRPAVDRLSMAIVDAVRTSVIRDKLVALGLEPTGTTPEELAAIMASDTARWAPVIKASGFTAD